MSHDQGDESLLCLDPFSDTDDEINTWFNGADTTATGTPAIDLSEHPEPGEEEEELPPTAHKKKKTSRHQKSAAGTTSSAPEDPNARIRLFTPAILLAAIQDNDLNRAQVALLSDFIDPNWAGYLGTPPLHLACLIGDVKFVAAFFERPNYSFLIPFQPGIKGALGQNALHVCCRYNRVDAALYLLEKAPQLLRDRDQRGEPALMIAARNGHEQLCRHLLRLDPAAIACISTTGDTILHLAARRKMHLLAEDILAMSPEKSLGYDIDLPDADGLTPLARACKQGDHILVAILAADWQRIKMSYFRHSRPVDGVATAWVGPNYLTWVNGPHGDDKIPRGRDPFYLATVGGHYRVFFMLMASLPGSAFLGEIYPDGVVHAAITQAFKGRLKTETPEEYGRRLIGVGEVQKMHKQIKNLADRGTRVSVLRALMHNGEWDVPLFEGMERKWAEQIGEYTRQMKLYVERTAAANDVTADGMTKKDQPAPPPPTKPSLPPNHFALFEAAKLFHLLVQVNDGYLFPQGNYLDVTKYDHASFITTAAPLPMEIQMELCCRVYGVSESIIIPAEILSVARRVMTGFIGRHVV